MTDSARPRAADLLLAAALGSVQTLAFVHTAAWPLPIVCLAWLAWRLGAVAPAPAAALGFAYGTAWLASSVWWLFVSMHRYGGLPAWMAAGAVLLLSAALSLYLAAACAAYARWRRGEAADALLFAALWLLAELARGVLFTGFPWAASGYSQVDAPLAVLAPWVGVYAMGAVLAWLAAALARAVATRGRAWRAPALGALACAAGAAAGPMQFTSSSGVLSVALLQTNVAQDEKFALDRMPGTLAWVEQQLRAADADLVVAPETAVPLLPDQLDELVPGYWRGLRDHFGARMRTGPDGTPRTSAALVGVPLGNFGSGYTNSVVGLVAGPAYRYDKNHLVPFGEFIPFGFRWFTEMMNIPLGDFNRGVERPPSFAAQGQRLAPNICYEDLFGEELARRFSDPASAPTMMVNLSNIAWFGDTIAIEQHLNISRLRALEFQRPMLRSTNTGATAIVDHLGAVVARLAPQTRGVLLGRAEGRVGNTPFAWWSSRAGLWPPALAALAVLGWSVRRRRAAPGGGAVPAP